MSQSSGEKSTANVVLFIVKANFECRRFDRMAVIAQKYFFAYFGNIFFRVLNKNMCISKKQGGDTLTKHKKKRLSPLC